MGRRADHTRSELYDKALKAADRIVMEEGLPKLTIRKIASEMGYSVGTLYNLFDNLDDLILHLNGRTCDAFFLDLQKTGTKNGTEKIKALAFCYLAFIKKNAARWEAIFAHQYPKGQAYPLWFLDKVNRPLVLLEEALGAVLPGKKEDEIKKHARIMWGGLHGIGSLILGRKLDILTGGTGEKFVEDYIDVYLKGLGVK